MSWHSEVRSRPRYYFDFLDNEDFVKECLYAADPSVLVDIGYLPPGSDPSATASILGADCPMLLRRSHGYFSQPSQVVVRREPSRVAFISIVGRSTFRAEFRTFQSKERVDMRAHRTFLGFAIAIGCGITLQSTAFSQEYRGTWEQQMACTPDVWRLCGAQVPDVDRIVACLRRNTPRLSGQCRAVFEQSDNAPRRGEDRAYGQRRYDRDYGPKRYDGDYGPRRYDKEYGPRRYEDDDE